MSTTTLVDFTDAQMLDYATDGDFSMQNSPADWLAVEATMLDDNPTSAATDYSEAIEVDMEHDIEHDGEITEYEMADNVHLDVDYDGDAQFQDAESEENTRPADSELAADLHPAGIDTHQQYSATQLHYTMPPTELAGVSVTMADPSYQNIAHGVPSPHLPDNISAVPTDDAGALSVVSEAAVTVVPATRSPAGPEEHSAPITPHAQNLDNASTLDVPPDDYPAEVAINVLVNEHPEHEVAAGPSDAVAVQHRESEDGREDASANALGPEAREQGLEVLEAQDARSDEIAEADEEADPHEISEGVYIDPPPAVLLSLPSAEPDSVCLFNNPPSSSGSQSPRGPSTSDSSVSLVLHQQPTLYYEPMNNVFAALRQEPIVVNLPELVNNELILEAYDLNLVLGEDNVYTSQVTIHELNDLHDRLGLSGPLRLRLSSGPRFITRFHALREQIAQVTLGADEQESASEQAPAETNPEQHFESVQNASDDDDASHIDDPQDEDASDDTAEDVEDRQSAVVDTAEEQKEGAPDETEAQETQDDPDVDSTPDEEPQIGEEYVTENAQAEEVDDSVANQQLELTAAPPVEGLDADEVHRSADAAEGGDYTEYQEEFPDDDDKFGDALPEEFGGIAADETEHAVEHSSQKSEDDEDADPELAVAELDDIDDDEHEQSGHENEPIVVRADEVSLAEEEVQDEADDVTDHDTNADSEETENLYEYDDAPDEHPDVNPELYEAENWDELEDPEDVDDAEHAGVDDAASKQSSETLATQSSKRSRDDSDDDNGSTADGPSPDTPNLKRVRTR